MLPKISNDSLRQQLNSIKELEKYLLNDILFKTVYGELHQTDQKTDDRKTKLRVKRERVR